MGSASLVWTAICPFAEGIISYLRDKCGGNVREKGIVDIAASSNAGRSPISANYGWGADWRSKGAPDSWTQFDCKSMVVRLTHSSLRSAAKSLCYPVRSKDPQMVLIGRIPVRIRGIHLTSGFVKLGRHITCSLRKSNSSEPY